MRKTLLLMVFWAACAALHGQVPGNPFELVPRLPADQRAALLTTAGATAAAARPDNPFDLIAATTVREAAAIAAPAKPVKKAKPKPIFPTENYRKFLFGTTMFSLLLLTLLVTLFRGTIAKVYRAVFNDNMLSQAYREREGGGGAAFFIVYSLFFVSAGLFVFLVLRKYGVPIFASHFLSLLACIGGVLGVFMAKHLLLRLLGSIFPLGKELRLYSFTIMVFAIFMSLLIFPVNLLLAYGAEEWGGNLVYLSVALAISVYLLRSVRALFIANKYLLSDKFHFLLYLCAVEIGPAMVLYKLFADYVQV